MVPNEKIDGSACAMADVKSSIEKELDYGFRWFEYHAQQRITTFNLYTLVYSGLAAATAYFLKEGVHAGSIILSILMILVNVLFWQLDVRSRQLIDIGEKIISSAWTKNGLDSSLNPVELAAARQTEGIRFKHLFGAVFSLGAAAGFAMFVYALYVANK